jgi:PAS domain S-box-containing protein
MSDLPSYREILSDARVAVHATGARPAWLWSPDGTHVLWANAAGAAIFDRRVQSAFPLHLEPNNAFASQIARLAGGLAQGGQPRLERLRGIGGGLARPLLCSCSRLVLATHRPAILVMALEAIGPALSLAERARRLAEAGFADEAAAAFSAQGQLLFATPAADAAIGMNDLRRIGAEFAAGRVAASGPDAPLRVAHFGQDSDAVAVMTFAPRESTAPEPEPPAPADDVMPVATHLTDAAAEVAPPAHAAPTPAHEDAHAAASGTRQPVTPSIDASSELADEPASEAPSDASAEPADEIDDIVDEETVASPSSPLTFDVPWFERRHPLRFVWQMDSEGRFTLGSEEFSEVIGSRMAMTLGRPWKEIASELALDPDNQVARAVATRDTWSGITVSWPVEGSPDRLKVEMSGLPIFDRARAFLGYRGFGVCRDVERINVLTQMRQAMPDAAIPSEHAPPANDAGDPSSEPTADVTTGAEASSGADERPSLTLVPAAQNVVPFRGAAGEALRAPVLSAVEHNAFRELARQLTARLRDQGEIEDAPETPADTHEEPPVAAADESPQPPIETEPPAEDRADAAIDHALLERLPVGLLIYKFDQLIFANRTFLEWAGHHSLDAFAEAGGLDSLLIDATAAAGEEGREVTIAAEDGGRTSPGHLFSIPWGGDTALVLVIDGTAAAAARNAETAAASAEASAAATAATQRAESEARELAFVVEAASDAVFVIDREGRILSANRRAHALFRRSDADLVATPVIDLFAPESQRVVRHQFDLLLRGDTAQAVSDGREVAAQTGSNGHMALLMTVGRIGEAGEKFCVVLRDITAFKTQERELVAAKLQAERASRAKSDFLAKVSHEIRTPLNSIIGFSDVMIDERFGPIGNERYREYLKDIRASGEHVVSLLNDLLDLAKIEAGKLELNFVAVNLNEMIQACVMLMQPQANREHIIIRTSLMSSVKPVIADAKSVRQIVLNLLSNSVKFTGAGGQVIVSTALGDDGAAMMRVRDTGIGMSESDLAAALEPFRQLATAARWGSAGTGLGLPLTKALVEANRASFAISSKINEGTLVEITFPPSRLAVG